MCQKGAWGKSMFSTPTLLNGTPLIKFDLILFQFIKRHNIDICDDYLEGTIHCKEGSAPLLVERIYEILTNRL